MSDTQNTTENTEPTILDESAEWYNAFRGGPASVADITKATKADKADVEATLEDMKRRQLVEDDEASSTDKTPRYRLSQLGRNQMQARYPA